jgi:hypothetical protein
MRRTSDGRMLLAMIVVPRSSRMVMTGVITSLRRACWICSCIASILLSLACMVAAVNFEHVSGKYTWKVKWEVVILIAKSQAVITIPPSSWPASARAASELSKGPIMSRSRLV